LQAYGLQGTLFKIMNTIQLTITGMTCGHCEKAVMTAIKSVDINAQASIDRAANSATISSEQPNQAFVDAIAGEGYAAKIVENLASDLSQAKL
jgi:copper chaperone